MITPGLWENAKGKVYVNTTWGWDEIAICGGNVEGSPGENARLIAAAVNAVREAGYTVEDLEAGRVQENRDAAIVHSQRNSYCPSCGRVMVPGGGCYACGVDLAACQEALRAALQANHAEAV